MILKDETQIKCLEVKDEGKYYGLVKSVGKIQIEKTLVYKIVEIQTSTQPTTQPATQPSTQPSGTKRART